MGNLCGSNPSKSDPTVNQPGEKPGSQKQHNVDLPDYKKMVEQMKLYHLDRMRMELEKDPQTFILDNLLMCIQFFDNFEKSVDAANEYRRSTEREMTELLAKDPIEGMILGDRRIKLLTGMSHILAQNYIYQGRSDQKEQDELDAIYGGIGLKDTFMTEGILPMEFTLSWDNFELYHPNEVNDVKDYSDAKGASPSVRLCMEQPDKTIEYPKGYVRLRCLNDPISHRKQLEIPKKDSSDFGYARADVYSQTYSDVIPEAHSDSDGAVPHSGPTSEDEDENMRQFLEIMRNSPSTKMASSTFDKNLPSTSKAARVEAGTSKPHLAKLQMPHSSININEENPSLVVHAATPTVYDGLQTQSFDNDFVNAGGLLSQHSKSSHNYLDTPDRYSPGKDTPSSGYETTSFSRSSSMQSSMLRDKWQKQNLKKLYEYGKKSRKDQIPKDGRYDPLPIDCYSEIEYGSRYVDLEEDDDDATDDVESSTSSDDENPSDDLKYDFRTGKRINKKKKKSEEDGYKRHFYLNSSQFSSNACSEFNCIGPIFSIPSSSLFNGVVLGTTIRCPIPYTYPKESEEEDDTTVGNYYVTYTFTPSLHSKSWPGTLYFHFNHQILLDRKLKGEIWPSRAQLEKIENLGCNTIPLGYRSVGFFNAEQILEWELNFHESEINLLDSFRAPHWRAYIFASLLFRAFIAPLGPQGVGLEHIRNILYCMCYEDFSGWNEEQPGAHLNILLEHLSVCLSKKNMPSFFVRTRNLLQSIPPHNLHFIHGHVSRIRENVVIYCIYAFRNLRNIRKTKTYAFPNLKSLYEMLTFPNEELLHIVNPLLRAQKDKEDEENREKEWQQARSRKKKQKQNLLDKQDVIDKEFFDSQKEIMQPKQKRDRYKERLHKEYEKHKEKMKQDHRQERKNREEQRLKDNPEHRLPGPEKRPSIDLKKAPLIQARFTPFRLLVVIKFFITHFIELAKKATEFQNYSLATMYVIQVENLCDIAQEEQRKDVALIFSEIDFDNYREQMFILRGHIGDDIDQYIISRYFPTSSSTSSPRRFSQSQLSQDRSLNELSSTPGMGFPTFTNNWDLRKLPTPPPSEKSAVPPAKKLVKPNIVGSLQSFDSFSNTRIPTESSTPTAMSPTLPPSDRNKPRRQESLKFVSTVLSKDSPPPATPPRMHRSVPSSRLSISLDRNDDEAESTDL